MMISNATCLAIVAVAALALTNSTAGAQGSSIDQGIFAEADQKTQQVSTEQLRRILADGSGIVLDTRSRAEFEAGHIPGASNLDAPPPAQVAAVERLASGDKSKTFVLYCNGPYCQASRRVADHLLANGFTNVRRYQLGIPIWRALGGPTEIELGGIVRIFGIDQTAVFIDGRSPSEFAKGSIAGAHNVPAEELAAGTLKKLPLPEDDFNRRIVLFGSDAAQARKIAEVLRSKPWHNVAYFPGSFEALTTGLKVK